jgi:outer membrane protein assembly factor BamB
MSPAEIPDRRIGSCLYSFIALYALPALLIASSAALVAGCGSLKLGRPVILRPGDWPTFAMTERRVIKKAQPLTPPLALEWEQDVQGGIGNGSPLVVDSLVFIGNLRGDLQVFQARTGKRFGSVNLGEAVQGSPVIDGNVALVALSNTRESLLAYDLSGGQTLWKRAYGDIEVSPLLFDRKVYVGTTNGTFYCVERYSGDMVWKFTVPENQLMKGIRSSPSTDGATVVFGSDNGCLYALDAVTGRLRWRLDTGAPVMATPCIIGGAVYVGTLDGTLYALDVGTGSVRWKFRAGTSIYATVSIADSLLFFGTTGGSLFALHIADGSLGWKRELDGPVNSSAVPSGGLLYVGTLKHRLVAINANNGDEVWGTEVEGRIKTTPVVADGMLFVATDDRTLLAFRESQR